MSLDLTMFPRLVEYTKLIQALGFKRGSIQVELVFVSGGEPFLRVSTHRSPEAVAFALSLGETPDGFYHTEESRHGPERWWHTYKFKHDNIEFTVYAHSSLYEDGMALPDFPEDHHEDRCDN